MLHLERNLTRKEDTIMILIYGMDTCPDCTYLYSQIENRKQEFEYRNIGEHVSIFKEFLRIRDHSQVFDECKELGYAGIPCFVREDGSVTIIPEEVGLMSRPDPADVCNVDGMGC